VRIFGISLALVNLLLWFCVPAIRAFVDETTGRWATAPHKPQIVTGVQELLVYFDPWLARVVFPLVYVLGLAAIPFLTPSPAGSGSRPGRAYAVVISLLLIALEMVWLLLIAVGVFLRGPNWNIYWPDEWDEEDKLVLLNNLNLSDSYWLSEGGMPGEMSWAMRELPGLVLMGVYLLAGIVLAYVLFRSGSRATRYWRWAVVVLLFQLASLVPLKMLCRWAFNTKYWIYIPEYGWNV
jgi:hypothetical protein